MKKTLTILFTLYFNLLFFQSYGQITIASKSQHGHFSKDFLYHWDGNNIKFYGHDPYFVGLDLNPRVPQSGDTFTNASTDDSFGYKITAVAGWDSDSAINALNDKTFIDYINALETARVKKHPDYSGGLKLGFGVDLDNKNEAYSGDDSDRVDSVGEALILTFDTSGQFEADDSVRYTSFVPEGSSFTNTGLNTNTALRVSDIHLEPSNTRRNNPHRTIDYFIYDASENAILSEGASDSGMVIGFPMKDTEGTLTASWTLDDGDMIILAYRAPIPAEGEDESDIDFGRNSWGLWSLKLDLVNKSTLSSNSSIINPTTILYPNPAPGSVNIQLNKTYTAISAKLYSIEGKEVLSFKDASKNKLSIDIESLNSGIYFLILNLDDTKSTIKVIKN